MLRLFALFLLVVVVVDALDSRFETHGAVHRYRGVEHTFTVDWSTPEPIRWAQTANTTAVSPGVRRPPFVIQLPSDERVATVDLATGRTLLVGLDSVGAPKVEHVVDSVVDGTEQLDGQVLFVAAQPAQPSSSSLLYIFNTSIIVESFPVSASGKPFSSYQWSIGSGMQRIDGAQLLRRRNVLVLSQPLQREPAHHNYTGISLGEAKVLWDELPGVNTTRVAAWNCADAPTWCLFFEVDGTLTLVNAETGVTLGSQRRVESSVLFERAVWNMSFPSPQAQCLTGGLCQVLLYSHKEESMETNVITVWIDHVAGITNVTFDAWPTLLQAAVPLSSDAGVPTDSFLQARVDASGNVSLVSVSLRTVVVLDTFPLEVQLTEPVALIDYIQASATGVDSFAFVLIGTTGKLFGLAVDAALHFHPNRSWVYAEASWRECPSPSLGVDRLGRVSTYLNVAGNVVSYVPFCATLSTQGTAWVPVSGIIDISAPAEPKSQVFAQVAGGAPSGQGEDASNAVRMTTTPSAWVVASSAGVSASANAGSTRLTATPPQMTARQSPAVAGGVRCDTGDVWLMSLGAVAETNSAYVTTYSINANRPTPVVESSSTTPTFERFVELSTVDSVASFQSKAHPSRCDGAPLPFATGSWNMTTAESAIFAFNVTSGRVTAGFESTLDAAFANQDASIDANRLVLFGGHAWLTLTLPGLEYVNEATRSDATVFVVQTAGFVYYINNAGVVTGVRHGSLQNAFSVNPLSLLSKPPPTAVLNANGGTTSALVLGGEGVTLGVTARFLAFMEFDAVSGKYLRGFEFDARSAPVVHNGTYYVVGQWAGSLTLFRLNLDDVSLSGYIPLFACENATNVPQATALLVEDFSINTDGVAIFRTSDGQLVGVDVLHGRLLWTQDLSTLFSNGGSSPLANKVATTHRLLRDSTGSASSGRLAHVVSSTDLEGGQQLVEVSGINVFDAQVMFRLLVVNATVVVPLRSEPTPAESCVSFATTSSETHRSVSVFPCLFVAPIQVPAWFVESSPPFTPAATLPINLGPVETTTLAPSNDTSSNHDPIPDQKDVLYGGIAAGVACVVLLAVIAAVVVRQRRRRERAALEAGEGEAAYWCGDTNEYIAYHDGRLNSRPQVANAM